MSRGGLDPYTHYPDDVCELDNPRSCGVTHKCKLRRVVSTGGFSANATFPLCTSKYSIEMNE